MESLVNVNMWESFARVQFVLYPALFNKILFKEALTNVFVHVRKGDRNVLAGKNFCFD
jgi:hypothetical protein